MYLSKLKYTWALLLLASAARAEVVVVPAVFEDFPGTVTVGLISSARPPASASRWRMDVLLRASELGPGPMTISALGLRLKRQTGAPPVLRGSVTLSASAVERLDERFAVNPGPSPIAFFATSRHIAPAVAATDGGFVAFDLAQGFRYRPEVDGDLMLAFEVELTGDLLLDAAPASEPRLLRAEGFHARRGALLDLLPIIRCDIERDRPPPAMVARAPRRPPPRPSRSSPASGELASRVQGVQSVVASLEDRVDELVDENRKLQSLLESRAEHLAYLFIQQRVEAALASGKPTLGLLQEVPPGGELDMARAIIRELLRSWPANPRAAQAAAIAAEGDAFLEQERADMALESYSRAYRTLLATTAADGRPPILNLTRSELPRLLTARGLGPYDVLSADHAPTATIGRRSVSSQIEITTEAPEGARALAD